MINERNKYLGKYFSILGDSISTLQGYNPEGYKLFYEGENCIRSGVVNKEDTWWDKVIRFFDGQLLVNNSWSGSRVTKLPGAERLFPSGCSDERTSALHKGDVKPDVIIVYLGTNDWGFGAKVGDETSLADKDDNECFEYAYNSMIEKLRSNYPQSEIWCCTLCETCMQKQPDFRFPHSHGGNHIERYNEVIGKASFQNRCKFINLYSFRMPYDTVDGSHPTKTGMDAIATMVIRCVADLRTAECLDCKDGMHAYQVVEECTGGTRWVCMKCGKEKYENIWDHLPIEQGATEKEIVPSTEDVRNESEYVRTNTNKTVLLYGNILKLTVESRGETVKFQQDIVKVGRSADYCDLSLDKSPAISRHHASFVYENNIWFLQDQSSTNGTWLNDTRIQPGKKYELVANDEICFAAVEKVIFYKTIEEQKPIQPIQEQLSPARKLPAEKIIGGRYEILRELGKGVFAPMYLVRHMRLCKVFAMIVCDKKSNCDNPIVQDSMIAELCIMKKLEHPAIPRVINIEEDEEGIYIIRDYVKGETLESIVTEYGPMPPERVVALGKQLCDVLAYLHARIPPVIYRDMKPANVVLKPDGEVMIQDFGLARTYKENQKGDTVYLGTVGYAAPEQYGVAQSDARTDIYGLGMTMFRLVTGEDPRTIQCVAPSIRSYNPDLPKGLEYIISKCTNANPAERYQSCMELMSDLEHYLELPRSTGIFGKMFGKK